MSITRKSMMIKLSFLVINMVLVFFLARHFILERFTQMETDAMIHVVERAKYMLEDAIDVFDRDAMDYALDYATWNPLHDRDLPSLPTFLKSHQGNALFTTLNLNLIIVTDDKGTILHAEQFDLATGTIVRKVDPEILAHFSPASPLVHESRAQIAHKGFIRCANSVMMIASRPLLDSSQTGTARGMIIFGRFLDMSTVKPIARNLDSELFFPKSWIIGETQNIAMEKEFADHVARGQKVWADGLDSVMAGGAMTDVYGKDTLMVVVKRPRTIYQMGYQNFLLFINIMFVVLMLSAFVNLQFLRTIVLRRMTRLSRQVSDLAQNDSMEGRIDTDEAHDEITGLSHGINRLLDSRQNMLTKIQKQQNDQTFLSKKLALAQMGSGIAHEISNPFATIMATTHHELKRIQAGGYTAEQAEATLQLINKTTQRISQIIAGMRSLIRDGSGDPMEPHEVDSLIDDAVKLCSNALDSRKIALLVGLPSDQLSLHCRAIEIVQVLVNLITNAKDALSETPSPWIRIQAEKNNQTLKISITNNGPRIPVSLSQKIMEPFFSTKEVGQGSGLGLSISQKIIEEHKGRLYLDQGHQETCFVLEFFRNEDALDGEQADIQEESAASVDELLSRGL